MKNKKTLLGLLLIVVMLLSTALFVSCKKEENPDTGKGEIYYLYENGELNKSNFIQLKDGKWSDDDNENGTYVVSGTSITIYVEMMGEKEEYAKGTLKDGVLTLTIMGTEITYCKEGKTPSVTPSTPDEPEPGKQDEAVITAIKGAEINGTSVFMLVDETTDSVSLSSKVTCSEGSVWKLYYDKLGQVEIPTKIAAGQSGELNDGDNIFYIVVTSGDSTKVNVYEIKIHRQYEISVNYYDGKTLLDTEEITSGNTFDARYIPKIAGYTFNYWKNSKNQKYSESVLYESISLYADKSANKYTVSLDVNGGNELFKSNAQVTYDGAFKFEVPTRPGYTFSGWYVRYNQSKEEQLTNEKGNSLSAWNISEDVTVKAGWTANEYNVTLNVGDTNAGTVSGTGTYKYDGNVRITAQTKNGYVWLGWYDENNRLVSDKSSYNFTMGFDVTYTAKWSKLAVTKNISKAGVVTSLNDKYVLGQELKITATSYLGYDFVGWYCNDALVADSCAYTFRTSANNETYTAKWKIKDELKNFKFSSNLKFCEIEGVYDKTITKVVIPDYVTSIGDSAFRDCSGFASITIPDSVTSIGDSAFRNCSGLESITLPFIGAKLNGTENTRFGYIFGTNYYGESKEYIPRNLRTVVISNSSGVTSMGNDAFSGCSGLTNITIPDSVTSIGDYAFHGCSSLTNITIPNSVTSIGDYAFRGCSSLTSITIPNSLTSMGNDAFSGCSGLTSITIPDTVSTIGGGAFGGCSGLTSITIPDSVTSIGFAMFRECRRLESITLPFIGAELNGTKNTHFGYVFGASSYSDNSKYVPSSLKTVIISNSSGVTSIGERAFYECSGLTSITIPDNVTSIGHSAFDGCAGLTSITIPGGVTSIGDYAFRDCYKLVEVINNGSLKITKGSSDNGYVAFYALDVKNGGNSDIVNKNGYLFYTDNGTNYLLGYVGNDTDLKLPANYDGNNYEIYQFAFYNCTGLTSVTIPDSITSIGEYAFYKCGGLTSVTIPDSVTSIGDSAFRNCSGLTSVTIPDSVTTIGGGAFYNCSGLTEVIWNAENCTSADSSNSPMFKNCANLTSITIGDNVKTIPSYAFSGCSGLTSITIPDSVTSIGFAMFRECRRLESITLPFIGAELNGTKNTHFGYVFGASSYSDNSEYVPSSLKTVIISNNSGITSIGEYAFYRCSGLTSVTIPNSVTSIGGNAFSRCTGFASITIPDSVTTIGGSAFSSCSGLLDIRIRSGVTSIGRFAFV